MEEKKMQSPHKILFQDRQSGTVTGVTDVISFDEKIIILSTQCGKLTIKGEELHVNQLNLEKGDVELSGRVDTLLYTQGGKGKSEQKESLIGRLFQ